MEDTGTAVVACSHTETADALDLEGTRPEAVVVAEAIVDAIVDHS